MGTRTGQTNPALGVQSYDLASALPLNVPFGTITQGFDTVTGSEYIFLQSPGAVAGNDVTYDVAYLGTVVGAGLGQATAVTASQAGNGAWFKLKSRDGGGAPVSPDHIIMEDGSDLLLEDGSLILLETV